MDGPIARSPAAPPGTRSTLLPRVLRGLRHGLLCGVLCGLGGCVTTKPWQREHLASPLMSLDPLHGREALRAHLLGVQEGVIGGFGSGGGGCGCN